MILTLKLVKLAHPIKRSLKVFQNERSFKVFYDKRRLKVFYNRLSIVLKDRIYLNYTPKVPKGVSVAVFWFP